MGCLAPGGGLDWVQGGMVGSSRKGVFFVAGVVRLSFQGEGGLGWVGGGGVIPRGGGGDSSRGLVALD